MKPTRSRHAAQMKATLELTACMIDMGKEDEVPLCPVCEQVLNLHQPDESLPNQLLATCDACQRWYSLFGTSADSTRFLMLSLPDQSMIDEARFADARGDRQSG